MSFNLATILTETTPATPEAPAHLFGGAAEGAFGDDPEVRPAPGVAPNRVWRPLESDD
jgi:hypothetical protein